MNDWRKDNNCHQVVTVRQPEIQAKGWLIPLKALKKGLEILWLELANLQNRVFDGLQQPSTI